MPTKTTHRRRAVALRGAVLLLTTACGEGHGRTPQQLSEIIAESGAPVTCDGFEVG